MSKPKREPNWQELLAEIRADADRYNEWFHRQKLTLIKGGGGDSQEVSYSDKNCPPITAAVRSRASKARFKGGFVLMTFEGERDKHRNGLAVIQRNRLRLVHSRFTDEEIAILKYCDELFKGAKNE